jgi:hypothetical protein
MGENGCWSIDLVGKRRVTGLLAVHCHPPESLAKDGSNMGELTRRKEDGSWWPGEGSHEKHQRERRGFFV